MRTLEHKLDSVARRMTRAGVCRFALVVICVGASTLVALGLFSGASPTVAAVVASAGMLAFVVGVVRLQKTALDAARFVEQKSGWQEKLSTAYELHQQGIESAFRDRLSAEAESLVRDVRPAEVVAYDVLRPGVAAGSAVIVMLALWLTLPEGLVGALRRREAAAHRRVAATVVRQSVERLEREAPASASAREFRLRLIGLLDDLRRRRDTEELRQRAESLARGAAMHRDDHGLPRTLKVIADGLERSVPLRPLAEAIRLKDPEALRREAEKFAEGLPAMDDPSRRDASTALTAGAEASDSPGMADPLRAAAAEVGRADASAFASAMKRFEEELRRRIDQGRRTEDAAAEFTRTLERVRSLLAGRPDPGPRPKVGKTDVLAGLTPPADDNATSGNLVIRPRRADLETVRRESKSASVTLPSLDEILKEGDAARGDPRLDPQLRHYLKRYFSIDNGTE